MKHSISNHYTIDLKVGSNPYNIPLNTLFSMATRNNPKRRFLFVSKILGKHLPVKPYVALNYSKLLALGLYESLTGKHAEDRLELLDDVASGEDNHSDILRFTKYPLSSDTVFIGFAETATGMTHSVFEAFSGSGGFYHTTREQVTHTRPVIKFEEPHSHAKAHNIYTNEHVNLNSAKRIVLVDDEISTGQTLLNIMKSIKEQFGTSEFHILTYLDWRNQASLDKYSDFEKNENIHVNVISLVQGSIGDVVNGSLDLDQISSHELFEKQIKSDSETKLPESNIVRNIYIDDFSSKSETFMGPNSVNKTYNAFTGRFGLTDSDQIDLIDQMATIQEKLQPYVHGKTLVLGTEEFMYLPLRMAHELKGDIFFKSTTRSPVYPSSDDSYTIKSGLKFNSSFNSDVTNYVYNISQENYDTILVCYEAIHEQPSDQVALYNQLAQHCDRVYNVHLGPNPSKTLNFPPTIGSYDTSDVVFLLKEINDQIEEQDNQTREKLIQSGVHYSEMLPVEYKPSNEYMDIYEKSLKDYSGKLAEAVGLTAAKIITSRGENTVLVSLARAGTPAGVLIKKYIEQKYGVTLPHYSISIIRGKGIDENAMRFILSNHPESQIQFIDGWTGKGAITSELKAALCEYQNKYGKTDYLNYELAVIADPGHCVEIYGTREDFLIPNACLNSTVSGLLSRTIHRADLIKPRDFHGVKYYDHLKNDDVSKAFIETIVSQYPQVFDSVDEKVKTFNINNETPGWTGMKDVKRIQEHFDIDNIHFVKPGIGETTRVLLRRVPWKILINKNSPNLKHVLKLAQEKNIPVEHYPLEAYACCGIVKALKGE